MKKHHLAFLALIISVGCSRGARDPAEPPQDEVRARTALVSALDAWKQGKGKDLSKQQPPIRFVDEDFAAGYRLVEFDLVEPDAPILPFKNVPVILSLRDPRGRTVRRETAYQVTTSPAIAVLRSDP
jgi:hypothetical protein